MLPTTLKFGLSVILLACSLGNFNRAIAQEIVITVNPDDKQDEAGKPDEAGKQPFEGNRAAADMAILLDTSNSMDGLIGQAKSQLWTIVQQFAGAKKAGKTPALRVAVFEYGNTNLPASEGYIRQVIGLTDDLDKVSEALFSLKTQGGDEYCGQVINEALSRLDWSGEPNAFKAIFIAGNEPFTQGQVDYKASCKRAIESGVIVNTIHCGNYQQGISGKWQHGAQMTEGEYMNIDQDRAVVAIKTPHDKILIELNEKLNKTYLWYGGKDVRRRYSMNQVEQDRNAYKQQGAWGLSTRAGVKGGSLYSNRGRDLVDTFKSNKKILDEVKEDELPDDLQKLSAEKRKEVVVEMSKKRLEIQKEITKVNSEREKYLISERQKLAEAGEADQSTLGSAVQSAVSGQLRKSGFKFGK